MKRVQIRETTPTVIILTNEDVSWNYNLYIRESISANDDIPSSSADNITELTVIDVECLASVECFTMTVVVGAIVIVHTFDETEDIDVDVVLATEDEI